MLPPPSPRDRLRIVPAAAGIAAAVGLAAILLAPADLLPGSPRADLGQQFLAWRAFAADSLRHGHLPLWNPSTYAGEPFLAGGQSAVFYPLDLVFLALPLVRAVNFSLLLHALILGAGLYRWAQTRTLHPAAALIGSAALVFGGPVWPQIYAGHLSNFCALAWTPWILGGVEAWMLRRAPRELAIAAAGTALQILTGQMQYVFCTAVAAAGLAAFARLGRTGREPPHPVGRWARGLALIYGGAAALAAAQLLPSWHAAAEGLRQGTLSAEFAGQFSLPPENLLTAIAGGFFGDPVRHLYWGRCYPWEMSLFLGAGAALLIFTALAESSTRRRTLATLAPAVLLLVLALGRHTPLFTPLLRFGPGFGRFRGWSKFDFPAFVLLALCAAEGADTVIRLPRVKRFVPACGLGIAALLAIAGLWLTGHPAALGSAMARVHATGESYLSGSVIADPAVIRAATGHAGLSLLWAGGAALIASLSLALGGRPRYRPLRWGALAVAALELAGFAHSQWATFRKSEAALPELQAFFAAHPGDFRVQNLLEPNNGYLLGASDVWGNDPALLKRYAEFMAFTQGKNPDQASQNLDFHSLSPLYPLLRLRYILTQNEAGIHEYPLPGAMDRVQLVPRYRVVPGRDALFAALSRAEFDPGQSVLLESEPQPAPRLLTAAGDGAGTPSSVRVVADSPDAFTVEATTPAPAVLLVTDAYSRDWRARALPGSSQRDYQVLPADYALRATPLAAGRHLIRFEYRPTGLDLGIAISVLAWIGWLLLMFRRRASANAPSTA